MDRLPLALGLTLVLVAASAARADTTARSAADQLAAARKTAKPVFLLVTEPKARGVEALHATLRAAQRKAPHVVIVQLDRSAAANKPIVKRYGLAGARTPFALVLAHNGAPGGGVMPGKDAEAKLIALLPSPKKAETLLALFQRKAAFVVVGRPQMPGRAAALAACKQAVAALDGKAAVVEVGLDDKAEKRFLHVLGADAKAADVVVHVYGLSGLKTGIVKARAVSAETLVTEARKKKQCCPTGKCG